MARTVIEELVTIFGFEVEQHQLDRANRSMERWNRQARQGARNADMWGSRIRGALAAWVGFDTVLRLGRGLVEASASHERFLAQLETTEGSARSAQRAFERIEGFATSTPFALDQSLEAFVRLRAYGLTATEEAMRSYGDTASSMGRDLMQMVEAVGDATTGEFERLKEFGIRASSEGDNVRFTFRGVETVVRKSAEDIERYLINLGQANFSGAMERQMDTVGGKLSNLGDAWQGFLRNAGEGGFAEGAKELLDTLIDLLNGSSEGAEDFGRIIGEVLRRVARGIEWAVAHSEELAMVVAALGGVAVAGRVGSLAGNFVQLGGAVGTVNPQIGSLIAVAGVGAAAAAGFYVEMIRYMEGQTSAINTLVRKYPQLEPLMQRMGGFLMDIHEYGPSAFEMMAEDAGELAEKFESIRDFLGNIRDTILEVTGIELPGWLNHLNGGPILNGSLGELVADGLHWAGGGSGPRVDETGRPENGTMRGLRGVDRDLGDSLRRLAGPQRTELGRAPESVARSRAGAPAPAQAVSPTINVYVQERPGETARESGQRAGEGAASTWQMAVRTANRRQ